jgi:hypothetical protein
MNFLTDKGAMAFMSSFEAVFKSVPHLPKGVVNFLVSVAPWLAGLSGILSLYGGVTNLFFSNRVGMATTLKAITGINPAYFTIAGVIAILTGLLMLMAFTPLRNRKLVGWMYLFWVTVLSFTQNVIGLLMGVGGLVGTLIGAAIGFYLVFELKSAYKK